MTYEETEKMILKILQPDSTEFAHCVENVLTALKNQIPRKPIAKYVNNEVHHYECECGTWLICESYIFDKHYYCPNCGQHIDWSEEE